MNKNNFGAKATVYIKCENDLEGLIDILKSGLQLENIFIKNDQEEPFVPVAMCEVLGFEIWVKKSNTIVGFDYQMDIESDLDILDRCNFEMFDLSPWLAKYIFTNLDLQTCITPPMPLE
jgi:hypothetical protein